MDVNPQSLDTTALPQGHHSNDVFRLVYRLQNHCYNVKLYLLGDDAPYKAKNSIQSIQSKHVY